LANVCRDSSRRDTLVSSQGSITAGRRFGSVIVVYKKNSMYLGVYVGPPTVWEFNLIQGDAGALSQEVVVNIGTAENPKHIFMGEDDFYVYDGSKPIRIGTNRVKLKSSGLSFRAGITPAKLSRQEEQSRLLLLPDDRLY
jgi:hypothetical protein